MASKTELAERFLQAFNNRRYNADDFRDYVAEKVVITMPATGQELHGYEGAYQYNDAWVQGFSDGHAQVVSTSDQGQYVETQFNGTGTFNGNFATPQGTVTGDGTHRVSLPFTQRAWIDGDKITRVELHFDPNELMRQMGLG
jgi:hypothetical protein